MKELLDITRFINLKPSMTHNQLKVIKVTKVVDLINQLSKSSCDGSFLQKKSEAVKVMSLKRLSEDAQ